MAFPVTVRRLRGGRLSSPNRFWFGFFVLKYFFFATIFFVAMIPLARAEFRDSLSRYQLDSVQVLALRIPPLAPSFVATTTVTLETLRSEQSLATSLVTMPGLQVHDYGGAGALATISFRGMDAAETIITLDGVRINSLQNGLLDLNKIPLADLSSASISSASISIDDATGGVLALRSPAPLGFPAASINASIGSFGEDAISANVGTGNEIISGSIGVAYEHALNNFSYAYNGETFTRSDADFTMRSFIVRGALRAPQENNFESSRDGPHHDLLVTGTDAQQGDPGSVTGIGGAARQADHQLIAQLHSQWIETSAAKFETAVQFNYADETYSDSLVTIGGSALASNSVMRSVAVSGNGSMRLFDDVSLRGGVRETFASGSGSDVQNATRAETQALFGPEWNFSSNGIFKSVQTSLLGRADIASDNVEQTSLHLRSLATLAFGASGILRDVPAVTLRAFIGSSGRLPSFNDLYWTPGGNPDLQTEHAIKSELGGHATANFFGAWNFDVAGYFIDAKNKIIWEPVNGEIWSPQNIQRVQSQGVTGSFSFAPASWLTINASEDIATHMQVGAEFPGDAAAGMQLPYVPQQTIAASIIFSTSDHALALETSLLHTSVRYTNSDNTEFLPAFTTINLGVVARWQLGGVTLHPALRGTNLTNVSYQLISGYPLPLRGIRFSLGATFNDQH